MSADESKCAICLDQRDDEQLIELKERGTQNLIKVSHERADKKYIRFEKHTTVRIHESCRRSYTKRSNIDAVKKRKNSESRSEYSRRSANFNFEDLCIFCEDDASDKYIEKSHKKPQGYDKVYFVSSQCFQENAEKHAANFDSPHAAGLMERLKNVDLLEVRARYHKTCLSTFYKPSFGLNAGRPLSEEHANVIDYLISYIDSREEIECQFWLNDMMKECPYKDHPRTHIVIDKLQIYYGDELIVHHTLSGETVFCFLNIRSKKRNQNWHTRASEAERKKTLESAAEIILQDVKKQFYDMKSYPCPDNFLNKAEEMIPPSLSTFLEYIILKSKNRYCGSKKWDTVVTTIAHILISAIRPRSFLSPVLLGLSTMLHKKHASRILIDCLSRIGLCSSYKETTLFEASIVHDPPAYDLSKALLYFVFDNADHNTNTIDGRNTFHVMGGVKLVTPSSTVMCNNTVKRLEKIPNSIETSTLGSYELQHFQRGKIHSLKEVVLCDLWEINPIAEKPELSNADILYFCHNRIAADDFMNWNGFMEEKTPISSFETTKVIPVPFVNAPASNYDTVFTTLMEANKMCVANNQKHTFVTYDLPLFMKAFEISICLKGTEHEKLIDRVIIRLGGFHCLMSFLAAMGYLMDGSGLREVFCEIYAENSVEKMLSGHAYSRALRGHLLVQKALAELIVDDMKLTSDEISIMAKINSSDCNAFETMLDRISFEKIKKKFVNHTEEIKKRGPTAALWMQYFEMVEIAKNFIQSERTGKWYWHLESMQRMIPFFHTAGRNSYAKAAHLYIQQMLELEKVMDRSEFDRFTEHGYFTVRRNDKYRSGTWTDMIVEQVLMRGLKSVGGLTHHGRMKENTASIATYIHTSTALISVCNSIENFCSVYHESSEQHVDEHVDMRTARKIRDKKDVQKIETFFSTHSPFQENENLISISSGIVADDSINCHKAAERGMLSMQKIIGKPLGEIKMERKNKVLPLKAMSSFVKIDNEIEVINPTLIFQRICSNIESQAHMKEYMNFELSPYPLSIFDEYGMRKTNKAAFYENFNPVDNLPENDVAFVIDGGFLLHNVVWTENLRVIDIIKNYIAYVQRNFVGDVVIVFDGYENAQDNIKWQERMRRQAKFASRDIIFTENSVINVPQEKFLASNKNKTQFIKILVAEFSKINVMCNVAEDDADELIVSTAIDMRNTHNVIVVAEDVDIMAMIAQRAGERKVFLLKPAKAKAPKKIFDSDSFKHPELKSLILFIHAFTGSDSTSAFFKQGKNKLVKLLLNDKKLQTAAAIFYDSDASPAAISENGQLLCSRMYSLKKDNYDLNDLRYVNFIRLSNRNNFNLRSLPPTKRAAEQHSLRVYMQVQNWLGKTKKNPLDWGWQRSKNGIIPVYTTDPLLPSDILKKISCRCAKGCKARTCTCKKHGVACTILCTTCQLDSCSNIQLIDVQLEEETLDLNNVELEAAVEEMETDSFPSQNDDNNMDEEYEDDDDSEEECENLEIEEPNAKRTKLK